MATTRYYRTQTAGAGDSRKKSTFSCWIKRYGNFTSYQHLFTNTPNPGDWDSVRITDGSQLELTMNNDVFVVRTQAVLRDVSAWYHLVVSVDTTQATASNRVKLYINGVLQTSLSSSSYPSLNFESNFGDNAKTFQIGAQTWSNNEYLDGSMANVIFCDGFTYDATSFGQTDATTGIWKPKDFSGSYGTNGFFLNFSNSASLGLDSSGNGNNFTISGTPTQTVDTPSNVFATLNPLIYISDVPTFSLGNLRAVSSTASWRQSGSTLGVSTGKWYWEAKGVSGADWNGGIGIKKSSIANESTNYNYPTGYNDGAYGYFKGGNEYYNGSSSTSGFTSYAVTDVVGIALDLTNNFIYYHKNGTWQNSGVPTSGATGTGGRAVTSGETWLPFITTHAGGFDMNFGNGRFGTTAITSPYSDTAGLGKFQYAVPAGYYSLCTKNINSQG